MDNKEYFNGLAFKWDQICNHNAEKLRKIIELTGVNSNSSILDVGTGTGVLVKYLLETLPSKVIGVDIAENMIGVARKKYKNDDIVEFIVSDILEFEQKDFDYIFMYSVYPHFTDKDGLFGHLSNLMNNGSKIIIAHSESKEKINERHAESKVVKDDVLPSAKITTEIMSKYFLIDTVIDNDEMYYILGKKE